MATAFYFGDEHIFTTRSDSETVVIKPGANENLVIDGYTKGSSAFFFIQGTGSQTFSANTHTPLTTYWNGTPTTTDITWTAGTGTATIGTTGTYIINYNINFSQFGVAGYVRMAYVQINSAGYYAGYCCINPVSIRNGVGASVCLKLTAGDTVRVVIYSPSIGNTGNMNTGNIGTFSICKIL